jgi:hypothetical protein
MGLASNRLNGTIPSSIGKLTGLKKTGWLGLSDNGLSGTIPSSAVGELTALDLRATPSAAGNGTAEGNDSEFLR